MLATARIADEHKSFNRIRQVAPIVANLSHGSSDHTSITDGILIG